VLIDAKMAYTALPLLLMRRFSFSRSKVSAKNANRL
jgi:hypothetical protein